MESCRSCGRHGLVSCLLPSFGSHFSHLPGTTYRLQRRKSRCFWQTQASSCWKVVKATVSLTCIRIAARRDSSQPAGKIVYRTTSPVAFKSVVLKSAKSKCRDLVLSDWHLSWFGDILRALYRARFFWALGNNLLVSLFAVCATVLCPLSLADWV